MEKLILGILLFLLSGYLGYPGNVKPIKDFELEKYLGKWYEIARLDHSFERGLEKVTAELKRGQFFIPDISNKLSYTARKTKDSAHYL